MAVNAFEIASFRGGLSNQEDKGIKGSFKMGKNLDIRKRVDSLSAGQALIDEGVTAQSPSPSVSPSASSSPSASISPSPSRSLSPSSSNSPSNSQSASQSASPSASRSPSASASPSSSRSPSSSVSPSASPSAGLNTVFSDLIRWYVKCSDGNTYGFGNTGKVYKRNSEAYWSQVYNFGKEIKGAGEKPAADGTSYMLIATNTELNMKPIPGLSNWNDVNVGLDGTWPKTNLTSTDWHTMTEIGGDMHIANKATLAFVGYDNSYTNAALDLIPGNIAKTIVERNGRAIVGTYRASDVNKGINGAIDTEVPLAQVGDNGEIFFANMSDTIPVTRFPGGGKVNPGGVANLIEQVNFFEWEIDSLSWIDKQSVGNMALFGVYGAESGYGGIYSYGRKKKDDPFVLNLEHALDVDEIGAITSVDGVILCSYRSGTSFGSLRVDSTAKATATYSGLDLKAPQKLAINSTIWSTAEVFMEPLPVGCSVQFWYKINKTGSFIQANLAGMGEGTSYTTTGGKKALFRIGAEGDVFEPQIVLVPYLNTTPEVLRVRIYFT